MNSKQPLLSQVIIWQSQHTQKPSADHTAMCHRMELCARSAGTNKYTDPPWAGMMRGEGRDSQGREHLEWFSFKIILFIYFWLCWVFVALWGLSLVASSGGYFSLWCTGFSLRWLLLWRTGSRCVGFSSYSTWTQQLQHMAPECGLSSCGART